jgi:hypothetical protein
VACGYVIVLVGPGEKAMRVVVGRMRRRRRGRKGEREREVLL